MMKIGERVHEEARLMLSQPDLDVGDCNHLREITGLKTTEESRGKGYARWLMCQVCVEADDEQTVLMLCPEADEGSPVTNEQLKQFYGKFGFEEIQTTPAVIMAREPKWTKIAPK